MPIFVLDEDGKKHSLRIRQKVTEDHSSVYAHGATGSFVSNLHFRLDFTRDNVPPLEGEIGPGGGVVVGPDMVIEREVVSSIYLSPGGLKSIAAWLTERVAEFEAANGPIPSPPGPPDGLDGDAQ